MGVSRGAGHQDGIPTLQRNIETGQQAVELLKQLLIVLAGDHPPVKADHALRRHHVETRAAPDDGDGERGRPCQRVPHRVERRQISGLESFQHPAHRVDGVAPQMGLGGVGRNAGGGDLEAEHALVGRWRSPGWWVRRSPPSLFRDGRPPVSCAPEPPTSSSIPPTNTTVARRSASISASNRRDSTIATSEPLVSARSPPVHVAPGGDGFGGGPCLTAPPCPCGRGT